MALSRLFNDIEVYHYGYLAPAVLFVVIALVAVDTLTARGKILTDKVPAFVVEQMPFIGAWGFWSRRWSFFKESSAASSTGNFSFYAGKHLVVGMSGDASRQSFFDSKQLGLAEGYAIMMGKMPKTRVVNEHGEDVWPKQEFLTYLKERLKRMVRKEALEYNLSTLIADTRSRLEEMAASPESVTDPFDSIYRLIYLLMMRTTGCAEIARDRKMLDKTLDWYHGVASTAKPSAVLFPWFPSFPVLKRLYYGARLYMTLQGIVQKRQAGHTSGQREEDPVQDMVDRKVETDHVIGVLLGALFSGQQNTSVSAAWLMVNIAHHREWQARIRAELVTVCDRHVPDSSMPLADRLAQLPLDVWESEFSTIELCVKENGRLHGLGAMVRQNIGAAELQLKAHGEAVPPQAFATYHTGDVHLNEAIYCDPLRWDPARYLPGRAEDKKRPLAWLGWGAGRHPCLGMRFAKLELNIIVALFLATFEDVGLCDRAGKDVAELPPIDFESYLSDKPLTPIYLKLVGGNNLAASNDKL